MELDFYNFKNCLSPSNNFIKIQISSIIIFCKNAPNLYTIFAS